MQESEFRVRKKKTKIRLLCLHYAPDMLAGAFLCFNSLHNSVKCMLLFTFNREQSNGLPKATHLIRNGDKIRIWFSNFQDSTRFANLTLTCSSQKEEKSHFGEAWMRDTMHFKLFRNILKIASLFYIKIHVDGYGKYHSKYSIMF